MPVATYTDFTLAANWTQLSLGTTLRSALEACGLTFVSSDIVSATHSYIFSYQVNPLATKSTAYIELQIPTPTTSVIPTQRIADNLAMTSAIGIPVVSGSVLLLNSQLDIRAFNHPEFRAAVVRVGGTPRFTVGFIRPLNKALWWSENNHLYAFATSPVTTTYLVGGYFCNPNPFSITPASNSNIFIAGSSGGVSSSAATFNAVDAPPSGGRDIIFGAPLVGTGSGAGIKVIAGWFSNDFILAGAGGLSLFDTLTSSGQSYMLLESSTTSMVIGIRVI